VVWQREELEPFGLIAPLEDPDADGAGFVLNLRNAGQYYDGESKLFYNVRRDYDPVTGRYVEADPVGWAAGISLYGYVGGNPLILVDPLGLTECDPKSANWKSVKQFGHTFSEHGAGAKNASRLLDRARGTGNPQGQWLNNEAAAEVLNASKVDGPATIRIPQGLGQVIKPDGTIVETEWATVVPRGDGFRTAYPILGP